MLKYEIKKSILKTCQSKKNQKNKDQIWHGKDEWGWNCKNIYIKKILNKKIATKKQRPNLTNEKIEWGGIKKMYSVINHSKWNKY